MMKKGVLLLSIIILTVNLSAASWSNGEKSPNIIDTQTATGETAKIPIGRAIMPVWKWNAARGVSFKTNANGELYVTKIAGEECKFSMLFEFTKPIKKFRFITPLCQGLNLQGGDLIFEYAGNHDKNFLELTRLSVNTENYKQGGNLPPQTGKWIELPDGQELKFMTLHFVIQGYVNTMMFGGADSNGAILEYQTNGDNTQYSKMSPDASRVANTYFVDQPPRFLINNLEIKKVAVFDVGRNVTAGNCELSKLSGQMIADLPSLQPGTYEIQVSDHKGIIDTLTRRFTLLHPPRVLTWEQTRHSPCGIVGINRDGRFRESADINGPLLGKMMGVHQVRGGMWSWVDVCKDERGKYNWGNYEERFATMTDNNLIVRSSVSWTPRWAVDSSRIKPGEWFGHYPPQKEFLSDFAEFCKLSAEKNPAEQEYEIWNEPNNEPYGSFNGSFPEFVEICKTAAEAVHSVKPDAKMILGTTGDADVGYIARLFNAGLSKQYSVVDIHPYRHTDRGPEDGLLGDIYRLKNVIKQLGDNQEIIFSEVGWPTHLKTTPSYMPVTDSIQACYNSRTLLLSLASGVKRIHFHILTDYGTNPDNPEHNFGFIKTNGDPKLTISSVSTTMRHLELTQFLGIAKTPQSTFAWYWKTPWVKDATLVTVWANLMTTQKTMPEISIPGKLLEAEDLWGGVPSKDRLTVEGNNIKVIPGADPIFLYIKNTEKVELQPLPPDLTPALIKRAVAPLTASTDKTDFNHLPNLMMPVVESKAMGFAGIVENDAKLTSSGITGENSSFAVSYNQQGMTLFVNIKSGKPMSNNNSGWWIWAGDCVRLYLGKNPKAEYMTPHNYQICIAPKTRDNGPGQAVLISYDAAGGFSAGTLIPNVTIEAANTTNGWTMKTFLPWDFFQGKPQSGDIWRFELTAPGVAWNSPADDKWNNPTHWGELEFQ